MAARGSSARRAVRFWVDPRFAIGLALIAASVAGVVGIVSSADRSVQVYAAREPLSQGEIITASDLTASGVRVDRAGDLYLLEGEVPAEGLVVTRSVGAGELIPSSAVGSAGGIKNTAIVVTVSSQLAGSIQPGSLVDLWAARELETSTFGPPAVVVASASVVRIMEPEGLVVDESIVSVELLVPRSKVARVLEALANHDALSLVPVSLPAKG